jgi:hypothetical protein
MQTDPPAGVSASPVADNVMLWLVFYASHATTVETLLCADELPSRNAVIIGPADTPFEDGTFRLVMTFDEQYPNKPPAVKFISEMFHPNVYATGELCLDILQNRWSPTYDVAAVLTSIQRYISDHGIPVSTFGMLTFDKSSQRSEYRLSRKCRSFQSLQRQQTRVHETR